MTTDNQDELFDIVDENDRVVGKAKRGEVHKNKKLIHRSIGIGVFNSKGEILLQKRSAGKDTDPLKWTLSASGHVISGDEYENTARRELLEELGINLSVKFVMKFLSFASFETEMTAFFKSESEGPFMINKKEIERVEFFSKDKLKKELRKKDFKLTHSTKKLFEKLGWI